MAGVAEIGPSIRYHRKRKGLSQKELAEKIGVSVMSIRRYELGDRVIPDDTLRRMAWVLGVDSEYLGSPEYLRLQQALNRLNDEGREMALELTELLSEVPRYQS